MIDVEPLEIVLEDGSLELDRRCGDGIQVVLAWEPTTNRVSVAVVDAQTGEDFRFEVPPCEALEAFRHPFAYDRRRADELRRRRVRPAARQAQGMATSTFP